MTTDTATWATGQLHEALVQALPLFVKDPFSASPRLDVPALRKKLLRPDGRAVSYETVYKWLRANRLNPRNVTMLVELANTEDNLAALQQFGRAAPKTEDFSRFLFA